MKPYILTIFGATGDLTHRKLLPAIYFLEYSEHLDKDAKIICVARRKKSDKIFRDEARTSIKKFSRIRIDDKILDKTLKRIHYFQLEFNDAARYAELRKFLEKICGKQCNKCDKVFYFATSPEFFESIVKNLNKVKLASKRHKQSFNRVVFEKPFGKDLRSAKKLNNAIRKVFHEEHIYRIDHYLAKELVQNLLVMRFGNSIFEPLWNTRYIDHVQITVAETLGIENRGNYYDKNGSLRDVVQNHIIQLLCLTAMESPRSLDANDIREEKVKVLKSIDKLKHPLKESVKGQYLSGKIDGKKILGYRQEKGIRPNSTTSSYFAIKFCINNKTWKNVPFYVRTGKRLKDRATEIILVYKHPRNKLFRKHHEAENNHLIIRVQPDEGIIFKFNAKVPGNKLLMETVNMDFCHECKFGPNSTEAYERLLHDVIHNDQTLFTRWDEVEHAWEIIDNIRDAWHHKQPFFYKPGTWGPKEANDLIERDGRKWIIPEKPGYSVLLEK